MYITQDMRSAVVRVVASVIPKGSRSRHSSRAVSPRNDKQVRYLNLLKSIDQPNVVIATGSAGTGKTFLATHTGVQKLIDNEVRKLVITRPAVSVDEQHGFLPGTLEKKMEPWIRPVLDVLIQYYPRSKIDMLFKDQVIEVCPLAFMRGRTFEDSYIICDEAQNTTINQMLMVLTRIGRNSKLVITGDPDQYDRGFMDNGLSDLMSKYEMFDNHGMIECIHFDIEDVERHPVIPIVLDMYKYQG